MTLRFSLDSSRRFVIKEWQNEAVVYDSQSNDTHLLETLACCTIRYLAAGPRSREEITAHLIATFDLAAQDDSLDMIAATLSNLHRIGIIAPTRLESR